MSDLIQHRGPDDEGYVLFSQNDFIEFEGNEIALDYSYHLAFGHRRLSILDLSIHGHQPMCDDSQRFWITYNGEVYNFIELRNELEKLGHTFRSHTDTEVVLLAFKEWGVECLQRFNGMFAFAIYDTKERVLFGARDRFGIKPFYYWKSPEGFIAMGSEIKQFTILPGWNPQVNHQAAYDFINWGMTNHSAETCFKNVYQLQGGHYFITKLNAGKLCEIKPKQWYQLPIASYQGSFEEAGVEFGRLLKDSIRLRCRADVSVGSCLSGGLDSSSIVCLAHEILKEQNSVHPQMTFSACSHHKQFDERHYMEYVINRTNVQSNFTYPDLDDLFTYLDEIIWHQDEPFGSTSIFAQWDVFNLVKKHGVKVMLDGQGADEQLAGYGGFHAVRFVDLAKSLRFFQLRRELGQCRYLHEMTFPLKHLFDQLLPHSVTQPIRRFLRKQSQQAPWIDGGILNFSSRNPHQFEVPIKSSLQRLCYSQITRTNLPMLLHYEDRDSMAHSIEARTPFLDYRLVEFIFSLPPEYKLENGITKRVLREGLIGILPEEIRNRHSKLGFATPEEMWVTRDNPNLFKHALRESVKASQGILNDFAIRTGDEIIERKVPFSFLLWRLIIFGRWMKRFSLSI